MSVTVKNCKDCYYILVVQLPSGTVHYEKHQQRKEAFDRAYRLAGTNGRVTETRV